MLLLWKMGDVPLSHSHMSESASEYFSELGRAEPLIFSPVGSVGSQEFLLVLM